jgi:uncharacterized protein with FMN-binding domain
MAQKTSGTLVALGTAAVTAIYMTGYLATANASQSLAEPTQIPVVATVQPSATAVPTATLAATAAVVNQVNTLVPSATPGSTSTPRPVPSATPTSAAAVQGAYKDGTYTGEGNSRRGGFDVAVTIQGGRVANVQITRAFTQYPASRVSALPGQVVSRQSAQVDNVSGATYSAQAFKQAVAQALSQAAA